VLARTAAEVHTSICAFVYVFFNLYGYVILFGGNLCHSVCGQASAPQQGHPWHWDRIDARARVREEAQDGLHRRSWRVKDETLTLKG